MDKELKAAKLGSMSVRKLRIQERQRLKELMHEQREERRKRLLRYSEIYTTDSGSDESRATSPDNDSTADTPSERSVKTPDISFSPKVEIRVQTVEIQLNGLSHTEAESTVFEKLSLRSNVSTPMTLGASLHRLSDIRYDRFSTIIEPVEIPNEDEESSCGDEDEDEDDEEDYYSPIEVAIPVAIRMPRSRPSVISVISSTGSERGSQRFSIRNINTSMISSPRPASQPSHIQDSCLQVRAQPLRSKSSGFLASEAKPVEVLTPSSASVISVEPSPTRSLLADDCAKSSSLKKKSSMPMLTKFTHARMSSIKNMMKPQSTYAPPPAVPSIPLAHQTRHESAAAVSFSAPSPPVRSSTFGDSLPSSPMEPLVRPILPTTLTQQRRPQTARMTSQSSITALPLVAVTSFPSSEPVLPFHEDSESQALARKKSFSNLRRRSESIGQVLKFSSSKTKSPAPAPDASLLPMPIVRTPSTETVQSLKFPTPPPPSPRVPRAVRRSAMMYSPFPPVSPRVEPVGLGLRV